MNLDSAQIIVSQKLSNLAAALEHRAGAGFLEKFFTQKKPLQSLYVFGGVGRGKTMLMKNFFDALHETKKTYFHFNSFMQAIHKALRDIRKEEKKFTDELVEAVKRVVKKNRLICFDEFQVVDIADAMLLSRIFTFLFEQKIIVVFTSNVHPLELYKNGLQREIFLEFVEKILLKNCEILHLDSPHDYRAKFIAGTTKRYFISNKKNREEVKKLIENFTQKKKLKAKKIKVWGREIKIKKTCGKIAVINFSEICESNFAAADFQAICENFDLIFLLKLPRLTQENANEARRLALFIDEVYEKKVRLIILAKTKIEEIFSSGNQLLDGSKAFARTVSRLKEIRSQGYWQ